LILLFIFDNLYFLVFFFFYGGARLDKAKIIIFVNIIGNVTNIERDMQRASSP